MQLTIKFDEKLVLIQISFSIKKNERSFIKVKID